MKKLTLLIASAVLATSCNFKASGNHGVIKLEHEPATAEEIHHKVKNIEQEHIKTEEIHKEKIKDSTNFETEESTQVKKNTEKANH